MDSYRNMFPGMLLFLCLLTISHAATLPRYDPRIVNGTDARPGEIPYQISIQTKESSFHFCGGSILNEHYVITAAHCVKDTTASEIKVIAGTIDLSHPNSVHAVESIIINEEYKPRESGRNDIALLKVTEPFVRSTQIAFAVLPSPNDVVRGNDVAVVSGWGTLWTDGPTPKHLQRVNIFIADQEFCTQLYEKENINVYSSQICAYDPRSEKGSCNGDSGGPLTVRGVLVGLVSWAVGCARTDYPTVYTRVSSHLNWIREHAV